MFSTREEYLQAFISEVRPMFDLYGQPLPMNVRITCGFPLNAKRSKALSDVFPTSSSRDNHWEIFISPEVAESKTVAELVIHELCRTVDGAFSRGVTFHKIADSMGLVPDAVKRYKSGLFMWVRTRGSLNFHNMYGAIIDSLGKYPHAEVSYSQVKTQGTRMLKAVCACGYTVRLTSKWARVGLPNCPVDSLTLALV